MARLLATFIPLLTLYLYLSFPTLSTACGIVVHNEVSYRSIDLFKPTTPLEQKYKHMLTSFPGFMQAGSFFPDWGYQCLGYNQQSEDAHWAPFIKTAIRYVRETYPQPWTDSHVQGLVVFIFAIMSHDVADVKWHSLNGLDDYFVKVMAEMEFDGNYQEAHTVADTGAEFTLQHASRLGYLNETWQVPLQDLVNIYALYYGGDGNNNNQQQQRPMVPLKDHLHYCMVAAFAGVKLDLKFGKWMFNYYGAKSPFMVDQLNDYHKGGLQDLSASVSHCYHDMIHSFENGIPNILCSNYFDDDNLRSTNNKAHPASDRQQPYHQPIAHQEFLSHRNDLNRLLMENGIIDQLDSKNGILTLTREKPTISHQEQQTHEHQQTLIRRQQQQQQQKQLRQHDQQHIAYSQHQTQYQRIINLKSEFITPLLPESTLQQSQIHSDRCRSFKETTLGKGEKTGDIPTLSIPISLAGFGHATVNGDFNGDGNMDLAISAPYYDDTPKTTMAGVVFILDGAQPMWRQMEAWNDSTLVLAGQSSGGRFGWAMAVVDFNKDGMDDLVVATPFISDGDGLSGTGGHIDIFFGGIHGLATQPNITIKPSSSGNEGFGSTLAAFDVDQDGYLDLLVGCPYCSTRNLVQAGKVDMFLSKSIYGMKQGIFDKADRTLYSNSPSRYEHFGSAVVFLKSAEKGNGDGGTLIIGAPGALIDGQPKVGKIYGFDTRGGLPTSTIPWIMSGKSRFGQFGSVLEGWKSDYLVVSSPTEYTHTNIRKYWQGGSVRLYDWHVLDRGENEIPLDFGLVRKITGQQESGHFGASVTFFEDKDAKIGLWVGEPLGHNEKGRLYRWMLGQDHFECLEGDYAMARFGSRIINVESDVICITSQHDSHSARVSGAVRLYQYA